MVMQRNLLRMKVFKNNRSCSVMRVDHLAGPVQLLTFRAPLRDLADVEALRIGMQKL